MAKSLRSKWRRKCRAVKRVRYGQKELERLKKTLGIPDAANTKPADINISELSTVAKVTDIKDIKDTEETKGNEEHENEEFQMDVDGKKRSYNLKTLKDQHGSCPLWLHQRKIKKTAIKKVKKVSKRRHKPKRNT